MILRRFTVMTALVLLSGCAVGPDYKKPDVDLPAAFDEQKASPDQDQSGPDLAKPDLSNWWKEFNDPVLDSLIDEGIKSNLDIAIAQARVKQSRALLLISYVGLIPELDTIGSYSRSQASKNGPTSTQTATTNANGVPNTTSTSPINLFSAGFDATWELDVFGGTRREIESARDALEAQIEDRRNTLITLLGDVAQNYVALRGFQREYKITVDNIEVQQQTLDIQRLRLDNGITNDLTVAAAETQLASTRSALPTLTAQIDQTIHHLSVLLAKNPAALKDQLGEPAEIPKGPVSVPAGLPSELLERRPDVREAERKLAAATANIGVATADLFPKFNLTGQLGMRSQKLNTLFNSGSLYWSAGPGVSFPILEYGAIWENVKLQNAYQEEALLTYKKSILSSLEDVENALVNHEQELQRLEVLRQGVDSSRRAVDLAIKLNDAGVVDFLNVLQAQQSLFQAQDQFVKSDQAVSTDLIALYKALGGGWETADQALTQ